MASLYLKTAVLWFVLAVCIGLYMGAAQDFRLVHVHVHLNLLGWASLALMGLTWASFPKLSSRRLGMVQFGLHNVGLAVFMAGITVAHLTGAKPIPAIAGGSLSVGVAVLLFAFQVLRHPMAR